MERPATMSFARREGNLTLDGDDDSVVFIERVDSPWMSEELFHTLWQSATEHVSSSCSFTKQRKRTSVKQQPPSVLESGQTRAREPSSVLDEHEQAAIAALVQQQDDQQGFKQQLLETLGNDIVVFPQPEKMRTNSRPSYKPDNKVFVVYAYANITDNYGLNTVLLVRLERLHGSEQIAITVKNTDPVQRSRMASFMILLQQRLQPAAPPKRPQAHGVDTSALFIEDSDDASDRELRISSNGTMTSESEDADTPPQYLMPPPAPGHVAPSAALKRVPSAGRTRSHTLRYRSEQRISFEGYLNKKGDVLPNWRVTYCILEGDTLAYYESREDFISNTKLIGRIQIQSIEDDDIGKPNGFRIVTIGHRISHLSSRTAFEKDQWMRAMTVAINKTGSARSQVAFASQALDAVKFYRLLGGLLRQELNEFPMLFRSMHPDVILTSNFPPIVPFWGQYRRYDGILLFFSTLLESVTVDSFSMLEVIQLVRGDADFVDAIDDQDMDGPGTPPSNAPSESFTTSPNPYRNDSLSSQPMSASTPSASWVKRLVVTGKETFQLHNSDSRRITQLFVHELWLDHKDRLVRWHMNGDSVALSVAFDDAARGENIRLVLPGESSSISQSIPPGTFYVQIVRAQQLHASEVAGGASTKNVTSDGKKLHAVPIYARCILEEGTHSERTLEGLDIHSSGPTNDELSKVPVAMLSEKKKPSKSTRFFRGIKRATGLSGQRTHSSYGDKSGCVTGICKCSIDTDTGNASGDLNQGTLNPEWRSNLRLDFPGCARGFTYFLKLEVFQSRFMLQDELLGVCKINLTPHLSLFNGSADAKANGALPRWHNLCDQYNDCKESWAPPTVFKGRIQVSVIFAPTISSPENLSNPKIQGNRRRLSSSSSRSESGLNNDDTLVQSMTNDTLRNFLRSDALAEGGRVQVSSESAGRFVARSSMRSPGKLSSRLSQGPTTGDSESQLKLLARDNHTFKGKKTVFDVPKKYQLIKVIGSGTYGEVIAASDIESGITVAIKKISNAFVDLPDTKRLLRELCLLRQLQHPNLICLYDVPRPERLSYLEDIYLVTDLMETDLHRVIHSTQTLTDEHVAHFMRQILRSIAYLHSADILHRDLKPSNILVTSTCELKLCDLGLARYVDFSNKNGGTEVEPFVELTEYVVTRWYRAPEILLDGCRYDKPSDLWSAGCILAELLGRKTLFPGSSTINQLGKIFNVLGTPDIVYIANIHKEAAQRWAHRQRKRPRIPFTELYPSANLLAIDLLEKLLVYEPDKRLTAVEALQHPYLKEAFRSVQDDGTDENFACYTPEEQREDQFVGQIDASNEQVEETKKAMQEAVFEQVVHFHPEAREYEELLKAHDALFQIDPVTGKLVPIAKK